MTQTALNPTSLSDTLVPRSAASTVYDDLRSRILQLELQPDTSLSRTELAKQYGVSLTPIREALQALEQDGLVRIRPQSGTVVTRIDTNALRQNHFLRISTEIEVVRCLAENPVEDTLKRTRAIVDMQSALVDDVERMDLFSELDLSFHRTLFEAAGVEDIHKMVARRQGHLARCQRLELPWSGKMESIVAAHRAILEAIENKEPQTAADVMRAHLTGTITRVNGLREQYPEYFN